MKTNIQLKDVEAVRDFVNIANKCDFDIDVQYRHLMFDGKSLVALLSMDLSLPLIIYYNNTNPVFEAMLRKYQIL